jgi:signal transduction histidine kinase/DNA-binding response OmpR family regulator
MSGQTNVPASIVHHRPAQRRILSLTIIIALGLLTLSVPAPDATAQTARVQFIHASPYAEAASIDVYRDGDLWLTQLSHSHATPFEDWPAGRSVQLSFSFPGTDDRSSFFFSKALSFRADEKYIVVLAGDPLRRSGEPAADLFVMPDALEASQVPSFPAVAGFRAIPDGGSVAQYWRGNDRDWDGPLPWYQNQSFGVFDSYHPGPGVRLELEARAIDDFNGPSPYPINLVNEEMSRRYGVEGGPFMGSYILDFSDKLDLAFINISAGFYRPRRPGDAPYNVYMILADGSTVSGSLNRTRLQFINDSPYPEAASVDVYINDIRVLDDLKFQEASPFIDLPSGLTVATSPSLKVDVVRPRAENNNSPLSTTTLNLLFERKYVAIVIGDPLSRQDQPPMSLSLFDDARERAVSSGEGPDSTGITDLLIFHGIPDLRDTSIGFTDEPVPMVGALSYGAFYPYVTRQAVDDTLYIADAATHKSLAFFDLKLGTGSFRDSALVLLTSGFVSSPAGISGARNEMAFLVASPSGGPLLSLSKREALSWWQSPWIFAIGAVLLGFIVIGVNQIRILRLRARELELENLVDIRTQELVAEKKKTDDQALKLVELDEAKNRFFANISHEFRTPLTMIMGPVQDAIDGYYGSVDPRLQREFHTIRRHSRRLLRLINQLLDLSRLEAGRMELRLDRIDLNAFIRDLTYGFVPLAERNRIDLCFAGDGPSEETESEPGTNESAPERRPPVIMGDPEGLEKVFSNLIANAIKFTPENGRVDVTVHIRDSEPEKFVDVIVSDTGRGIRDTDLSRIFDRFQQADTSIRRSHEGSGIGLTLAKELVELHDGYISVSSVPGKGSTFTVELPLLDVATGVGESESGVTGTKDAVDISGVDASFAPEPSVSAVDFQTPEDPDFDGRSESQSHRPLVLLVEDNEDVRSWIRDHIGKEYRLLEAEDGEQGLELVREHIPDLILSDVMMPRMDGYEMCRLIKANDDLAHIPVVMLTAKAGERDTLEGLNSGADDYLSKPFSMAELQARIANLIKTRIQMREHFSRDIFLQPSGTPITPADEVFLNRVLDSINSHLGNTEYNVDWMADEVGLSRRQLERRLETVTGEAPANLVRRLRLERASQLLRARAGTVSEVAYAVGFRSATHFSRTFREAFGESPSQHGTESERADP